MGSASLLIAYFQAIAGGCAAGQAVIGGKSGQFDHAATEDVSLARQKTLLLNQDVRTWSDQRAENNHRSNRNGCGDQTGAWFLDAVRGPAAGSGMASGCQGRFPS